MSSKNLKIFAYIVKYGLFVLPAMSLIIAGSLFFPFITGKNFFFRIGVEILLFFWIFLALFDRNYRPQKSPLLIILTALAVILSLATIFGENPYRSFWSNFERMEGLLSHLHLFAYFLILTSVFKKEKDFKRFFIALLGISVIVSVYGYLQVFEKIPAHQGAKLDATFGNSTYLAVYILFHLFIAGWLILKSRSKLFKGILVFLVLFEAPIIYFTTTRGTILGLASGLLIFALLVLIFSKSKKARLTSMGFLAVIFILAALLVSFKDSSFIKTRPALNKLASISFTEGSVEARLTIWKMSVQAFKEHPILGWGPENFNLVFNKYYQPNLWSKEPWFDRAHNVVFDWLIAAGILGLAAYLGIFILSFYILWRGYKRGRLNLAEAALFISLLTAYGFHNLFVFDNIVSYFLFFTVLGYVHYRYTSISDSNQKSPLSNGQYNSFKYLISSLVLFGVISSLYFANIKPMMAGKQLINTLKNFSSKGQDVDFIIKDFDKIFNYKTFATPEVREQLSSYANSVAAINISEGDKLKALQKAIEEMEKQIKEFPQDARYYIFLSTLYQKIGQLDRALDAINKALELSPKKQQARFVLADIYLASNQLGKAFEILKETYDLDQNYSEAAKNLAIVAILNNQEDYAAELLKKHFGAAIIADNQFINAYARVGNYKKVKEIWQLFIEKEPNNIQYHVSLAATHIQLGERQEAIKTLEKAIEANPQFKQQGEYYINELKAGRTP